MEKLYKPLKIGGYFLLIFIFTFGPLNQITEGLELNKNSAMALTSLIYSSLIIVTYYYGQYSQK
jgi:hypothetical protein